MSEERDLLPFPEEVKVDQVFYYPDHDGCGRVKRLCGSSSGPAADLEWEPKKTVTTWHVASMRAYGFKLVAPKPKEVPPLPANVKAGSVWSQEDIRFRIFSLTYLHARGEWTVRFDGCSKTLTLDELLRDYTFVSPVAHDFSDRYCASNLGLHCVACGAVERLNDHGSCKPVPGWRVGFEAHLLEHPRYTLAGLDEAMLRDRPPVATFAQSHSLISGGIFSLRDESC